MKKESIFARFKGGKSLRADFMFALLLAMIPAFVISLSFDYYFVYTQNMKSLHAAAERKVDNAVNTLKKPLWQYDFEFLQNYAEILADDNSLTSVVIYDERKRIVAEVDKSGLDFEQGSVQWEMAPFIVLEGQVIGRIVVNFNNSEIRRMSAQMIWSDILMMLAVLFSVWAGTWILIIRYVLHPLKIMKESFHSISDGDYSKRVILQKNNELTSIAKEFNAMVDQVELREKELRESEIKFRNLVESPSDIIFTTDVASRLVFINANYQKWTGLKAETLLGQPFSELFLGAEKFNNWESGDVFDGYSDKLYEYDLLKQDGTTIPVELNVSIQYDRKGDVTGAIGIARDITNRRQTEEDLSKYEQMVASITDQMVLVDRDFIIQAVNSAYIENVGMKRRDVIGSHFKLISGEEDFNENYLSYFEACLAGTSVKSERLVLGEGKKAKYMVITYYPILEQDGFVSGVMIHQRDLTEQKKLEAMLQQSQKMEAIGTLAGGIAHDFNNIIGGIIGYAEMIEMFDANTSPKVASRIEHVLKGAYRAKDLVEQILTFSRNADVKKKPLNLGNLVKDTMQFLRASIPSTIEIVKQDNIPTAFVWADETSIHQILMNLCTNAAHAMQEDGGELVVSLAVEQIDDESAERIHLGVLGSYVKLSIRDSGVGIDSARIERIFEPFYTTKKTGEGTGMGLAMVHGIIKNLRGAITVESTPGSGTTFHVYLPEFDLSVAEDEADESLQEFFVEGKGCILIVDDEQELVSFSEEILEHLGYEVVGTTSSVSARMAFMEEPDRFDLVITDQTMPNLTGIDLARQFLEIREDLPIILCTGFSQPNLEIEANEIGINRFVKKPFGARQLVDMVRKELSVEKNPSKERNIK